MLRVSKVREKGTVKGEKAGRQVEGRERARTRERMKTEGLALWRSREKTENFAV